MSGSVSGWLVQLKAGQAAAAQRLWERYFLCLVELARQRLRGLRGRMADAEDVALSAFDSFCACAQAGRFPKLEDRDDLWRLLVTLTVRKATRLLAHEGRVKRGGGAIPDEADLDELVGDEPTPEFAAILAEDCATRLDALPDAVLRQVALWKMEGFSNDEIAEKLGCAPRTVERKLNVIRSIWQAPPPA